MPSSVINLGNERHIDEREDTDTDTDTDTHNYLLYVDQGERDQRGGREKEEAEKRERLPEIGR